VLWAAVPGQLFDRIGDELELPAGRPPAASARPSGRHRRPLMTAVGLAAAVAVAFTAGLLWGDHGEEPAPVAAESVPGAWLARFPLAGTDAAPEATAEVEAFERDGGVALVISVDRLDAAPEGYVYEGRLRSDDGDEVGVGSFRADGAAGLRGGLTVVLWAGVSLERYPTLVIARQELAGPVGTGPVVEVLRGRADVSPGSDA